MKSNFELKKEEQGRSLARKRKEGGQALTGIMMIVAAALFLSLIKSCDSSGAYAQTLQQSNFIVDSVKLKPCDKCGTWTDGRKIYQTAKGRYFVFAISKKGNQYRLYLDKIKSND